jgi:hypothetical protein
MLRKEQEGSRKDQGVEVPMTIKSDKTVAQAPVECNENPKAEQNQKVPDEMPRRSSSDLSNLIRAEVANNPERSPEDLFNSLHEFVISLAQSTRDALDLIEEIMGNKDKAYPKGLMTPTFLAAFLESTGGHCQLVQIPEEIVEQLSAVIPAVPEETVH